MPTCIQCATSKVKCDKKSPCGRCIRRGTKCTPQTRKRGRPAKSGSQSAARDASGNENVQDEDLDEHSDEGAGVEDEDDEEFVRGHARGRHRPRPGRDFSSRQAQYSPRHSRPSQPPHQPQRRQHPHAQANPHAHHRQQLPLPVSHSKLAAKQQHIPTHQKQDYLQRYRQAQHHLVGQQFESRQQPPSLAQSSKQQYSDPRAPEYRGGGGGARTVQHEKLNVIRDESRIAGFLETLLHQSLTNSRFANSKRHLHNPATELLCQSIVQGTLLGYNEQALHAVLKVCEQLEIDGQSKLQWCKQFDAAKQGTRAAQDKQAESGDKALGAPPPTDAPSDTPQTKTGHLADTHVLNIQYTRLPKFINTLVRADPPAFLYAYYNGQQTFASNDAWERSLVPVEDVRRRSFSSRNWTVLDCIARSLVEDVDRHDFFMTAVDILLSGRCDEERSCVVQCRAQQRKFVGYVKLRIWTDSFTQSLLIAVQISELPVSKHVRPLLSNERLRGELSPGEALVESTQRLVESRKRSNPNFNAERELLTDEQLLASMLPLDEILELDTLDIDAVATYLH